jgi:hypothetical protein
MIYAEAAYFDGVHVAHIAAWCERRRLDRIDRRCAQRSRIARWLGSGCERPAFCA